MNTSKWILILLALLFVLALIFSLAEQGREKLSWEDWYHDIKARGGTLDWSDYIPPPVPDDQNFFKAPKMQEWFVETLYPTTNDWTIARRDKKFGEITASLGTKRDPIKSADDARDYLAWSDLYSPDFDLIREALKRPYARIDGNYSPPFDMPMPNFVNVRVVAQMLAQRAHCHLLLNQPDRALAELTLLNDSRRIMERAPTGKPMTLVDAMINVAVAGLYTEAIADGLQSHAWQEPQLLLCRSNSGKLTCRLF